MSHSGTSLTYNGSRSQESHSSPATTAMMRVLHSLFLTEQLEPTVTGFFFLPLVPMVLGHVTSKSEEVDQAERWAAKQGLLSKSEGKFIE